jgi:hypothetical protein
MEKFTKVLIYTVLVFAIAGCAPTHKAKSVKSKDWIRSGVTNVSASVKEKGGNADDREEVDLSGFGKRHSANDNSMNNYPTKAAGFLRGDVRDLSFGKWGMSSAVAYNLGDEDASIDSMIYVHKKYNHSEPLEQHFRSERSVIMAVNENAQPLGEEVLQLSSGGKNYTAYRSGYKVMQSFHGIVQPVYSEIVVWEGNGYCGKLRSVAPFDKREFAEKKNLELIDAVDWVGYNQS